MLHRSSLSDVPVYLTMPEPPVTLANKSDSEQIFARQLELIFFKERRSSAKPHNLTLTCVGEARPAGEARRSPGAMAGIRGGGTPAAAAEPPWRLRGRGIPARAWWGSKCGPARSACRGRGDGAWRRRPPSNAQVREQAPTGCLTAAATGMPDDGGRAAPRTQRIIVPAAPQLPACGESRRRPRAFLCRPLLSSPRVANPARAELLSTVPHLRRCARCRLGHTNLRAHPPVLPPCCRRGGRAVRGRGRAAGDGAAISRSGRCSGLRSFLSFATATLEGLQGPRGAGRIRLQ